MSMMKSKMLNVLILLSFTLQPLYSTQTFADPIINNPKGSQYIHNDNVYYVKRNSEKGTNTKINRRDSKKYKKLKDLQTISSASSTTSNPDGSGDKVVDKEVSPDGTTRTRYVKISPEDNLDRINSLCDGNGLADLIESNSDRQAEYAANVAAAEKEVERLKGEEADALKNMKENCHGACVLLGLGKGDAGEACKVDFNKLCLKLTPEDLSNWHVKNILDNAQQKGGLPSDCSVDAINHSTASKRAACELVLKVKDFGTDPKLSKCAEAAKESGGIDCPEFDEWLAIRGKLSKAENVLATAKAQLKNNLKTASCNKIDSTRDYSDYHPDCLNKLLNSCDRAKADATALIEAQYKGGAGGYCANCDIYSSKGMAAASILSAIGGIAVPLGLGGMQFATNKNAINAYRSMYMEQLQTCATVGIPCPPPSLAGMNLGISGYAMGSGLYGGAAMGGAMGGMYGGAMGGMFANANVFTGAQTYNPWMNGMVANVNAMINPQGYYPGSMYPGMGMMQPNMMQGQMNMMDVQHQMYVNQLRMAEMQGQMYAMGNGGIYGGGMYGQTGYPGMMGNVGAIGGFSMPGAVASANFFTSPSTYGNYYPTYSTGYPGMYPTSGCGGGVYPAISCGNTNTFSCVNGMSNLGYPCAY